jgi:hypothetical protein
MLNLGLMKIRLVSASRFFLPSADAPFIPVHVYPVPFKFSMHAQHGPIEFLARIK